MNTHFRKGFVKAAVLQGLAEHAAHEVYQQKYAYNDDFAPGEIFGQAGLGAGLGALGGTALGGMAGYMHGKNEDPAKDHRWRDAILGGAGGGLLGVGLGGYAGASHGFDTVKREALNRADSELKQLEEARANSLPLLGNRDEIVKKMVEMQRDRAELAHTTFPGMLGQIFTKAAR